MNSRNGGVRGANKKEVAPDPSSDGNLLDGEGRDASTRDKLEKQKPKEIKSWVQFRVRKGWVRRTEDLRGCLAQSGWDVLKGCGFCRTFSECSVSHER